MPSNAFPTPFNINRIQAIPGPAGERGSNGPPGVGNGLDVTSAPFSADPTGSADCSTAFADASTAAAADPSRTVYIPAGTYKHSTTATISGNLHFAPGAMLKPASGQTVTLSQAFADPMQQIFDLSLGGKIALPITSQIHPGWFGAKGDGVTDDTAAIQAALDAVQTYSEGNTPAGTVQVQSGHYLITKPLLHNKYGGEFFGAGLYATRFIRGVSTFMGPMIIAAPDYAMSLPLDTSLLTGPGQSLKMDPSVGASNAYAVNLRECPFMNFDGASAITLEFFIKIDPSSESGIIMASSGSIRAGVAASQAFYLNVNKSGGLYYVQTVFNTSAGLANPGNLVTTLSTGVVHHIAITYDGVNVKWWVDGNLDTTIAMSGTCAQETFEDLMLGWGCNLYPERSVTEPPFTGWLDSVRFSNNVRYTTNFTPASSKFAVDAHTMLLLNFDKTYHQCLVGDVSGSLDGVGPAASLCYLVSRPPTSSFAVIPYGNIKIGSFGLDCRFWCSAVFCTFAPGAIFRYIDIGPCTRGFNFWNNCYESYCSDITIIQQGSNITGSAKAYGDYAFNFDLSGIMTMRDIKIVGGAFAMLSDEGSIIGSNIAWTTNAAAQICFVAGRGDTSQFSGLFIDDEASSSIWQCAVLLSASFNTTFTSCFLDLGIAQAGVPIIESANSGLDARFNNATFVGCVLYPSASSTVCKGDSAQVGKINFIGCGQSGPHAPSPWAGPNSIPYIDGALVRQITSGSSSTANSWDQTIGLKVAGAYDLTTPVAPYAGQPLIIKDQQGDAGTNTKTVTANVGQTIDGAPTATITTNFGRLSLMFDGISDWMS